MRRLIAETRLEHQAAQIKQGEKPDNFLSPAALSDFERSHLRDAFVAHHEDLFDAEFWLGLQRRHASGEIIATDPAGTGLEVNFTGEPR